MAFLTDEKLVIVGAGVPTLVCMISMSLVFMVFTTRCVTALSLVQTSLTL